MASPSGLPCSQNRPRSPAPVSLAVVAMANHGATGDGPGAAFWAFPGCVGDGRDQEVDIAGVQAGGGAAPAQSSAAVSGQRPRGLPSVHASPLVCRAIVWLGVADPAGYAAAPCGWQEVVEDGVEEVGA